LNRAHTHTHTQDAKEQSLPWFRTFHWCLFLSATLFTKGRAVLEFCVNTPHVFEYGHEERLQAYEWSLQNWNYITFNMYAGLFMIFVLSLKKGYYKYQFGQLTWTVFSLAITQIQGSGISENIMEGYFWFIFPVMLIACNDTMAYFTGAFLGKKIIKRRFLRLSPKKTWEGFLGGMMCTLIFSFVFSRILAQSQWFVCPYNDRECSIPDVMQDYTYDLPEVLISSFPIIPSTVTLMPIQIHGLWLGLFASLVAPFGGFFASGIKRAYKVKDFNNLIPGHGGIMDRVDCQFIMACYTRVHYMTWIRPVSVITVTSILNQARYLGVAERKELVDALISLSSS
jgi:phosphatidate cytidylyltransferase